MKVQDTVIVRESSKINPKFWHQIGVIRSCVGEIPPYAYLVSIQQKDGSPKELVFLGDELKLATLDCSN